MKAGLSPDRLVLDPGLGFFKNARQSLELCARLDELAALGFPVLVGASRKSFITRAAGDDPAAPPDGRLGGSIAAAVLCVDRGATIVRTHDVAETRQALAFAAAARSVDRGSDRGRDAPPRGAAHA
jgi:dihydropteroate synthase